VHDLPTRGAGWSVPTHDTDRISNGRIEGTNNKIGVLKRVAYRLVNADNLAARGILLTHSMPSSS
jgi:hypothetical protein